MIDIREYGAVSDGKTVCTASIQRAIDLCPKGGTVLIPKGTFLSGALFLKSNMTLYLEEGSRILGSSSISDFPIIGCPYEGLDQLCFASLINTYGCRNENITICGKGVIDGNGKAIWQEELKHLPVKRGRTACLRNITNLTLKDTVFRNSPAWCVHIIYCSQVEIEGIQIYSKFDEDGISYDIYNADGIDLDSCSHVRVRNVMIESEDDCIAIKSGRNEEGRRVGIPSEDIEILDSHFSYGFGIAVGSEMSGGVQNVHVKNCDFHNSFSISSLKAIRGRGNYIRDIHFENCSIVNASTEFQDTKYFRGALYMDGFYGSEEFDADIPIPVDESTPIIENVLWKNMDVRTIAGNAIYLCGLPEQHFRNIELRNIRAHGKYGMKVKNIDDLKLENVQITCDEGPSLNR